ncbi:hypothetical protein F2Q69_00006099 [Brassica cretica]|uniref:Uncharacterized protein n=1 Tax=Brassica cretica TaxID=69181 RepID=A0A8S9NSV2_BRACR|nr:hypothetical protein F2Q69_00006099 [Brassica cretica]
MILEDPHSPVDPHARSRDLRMDSLRLGPSRPLHRRPHLIPHPAHPPGRQ